MTKELSADEIIDALGGTSKTARIFNINPASVTGWRTNGIPETRLMYLKLAKPELFGIALPKTKRTRLAPTPP